MSSPPAWSMGTGKRSNDVKTTRSDSVPGPGSYDHTVYKKVNAPNYGMGSSQRSIDYKTDAPGPGSYGSPIKPGHSGPKYQFTGKKDVPDDREKTPGPGSYDVTKLKGTELRAPSFSIRSRSLQTDHSNHSPGPGAYDQTSRALNQRVATVRMGSSVRDPLHSTRDVPGPGSYISNIDGVGNRKDGPKWTFRGKGEDAIEEGKHVPGPGTYNFASTLGGKDKGTAIKSRRPDSSLFEAMKVPGPGSYSATFSHKGRAPSYGLGTSVRVIVEKEKLSMPGPGNYALGSMLSKSAFRIGTSSRKPLNDPSDAPGPGSYELRGDKSGPKFGMVPRREDAVEASRNRATPGPGTYEPTVDYAKSRNPSFKVGTSSRDDLYRCEKNPGPGSYDVRGRGRGPVWGFGSEIRNQSLNSKASDPGPGAYNIKPKFADVPSYALSSSASKA